MYVLCWSEVLQFVARQHDRVLTYSAFAQRHLMFKLEQLPAEVAELVKQVCYTGISIDLDRLSRDQLTAQAGTAERF